MKSLMFALPLIAGLAVPAMAEDMHRYITVFKYSDTAMKAMTENPQDRGAAAAKLAEAFGGKMEAAYWFSSGGDYDGMVVWLLPNDQAAEALNMMTRASGNFSNTRTSRPDGAGVQGIDGESEDCEVGVDAADGD